MTTTQSVILGDAVAELARMQASSVDLIIADPPYNLGKDYGAGSDSFAHADYLAFTNSWLREADRVLKPGGSLYVFMGFRFISYLYACLEGDMGYRFQNWIVWHYTQGMGKTKGFSPRHDDILLFSKGVQNTFNLDAVRVPQKYYRARNNMRGANPGDVWEFSHVHYSNPNRQAHPTQKPEGLIERMVLASSSEGDLVLDPFAGSGTTLRVCQQLDRNAIGIEINEDYVSQVRARLALPFGGFDSIDPRMSRIPNDLARAKVRQEYLKSHFHWFLRNHQNKHAEFVAKVAEKYGERIRIENDEVVFD
ncbi:DNA-methyltransferase [Kordiimonas gwangyangensis]|uniref:DNA-methyltransferase n=1 Tax=Kordiimonas gwangyangensis TaxID=288022 RepID=UPI0003695393|nr:site-specific DNA-methyltransferase [Kordiimonas gwangyangensis]